MNRSRSIEAAFGTALLLGPLAWTVFAGTDASSCPAPVAMAMDVEPAAEAVTVELVEVDEIEPAAEQAEPEPEAELEVDAEVAQAAPAVVPMLVHESSVVLSSRAPAAVAYTLEATLDINDGSFEVGGRVDDPDPATQAALDAAFALYDATGAVCTVELTTARLHASIYGDVDWLFHTDTEHSLMARAAIARDDGAPDVQLESMLGALAAERLVRSGEASILADWRVLDGDCEGAMWAVPLGTEVAVWTGHEVADEAMVDPLESLRGTQAVADARISFDLDAEDAGYEGMSWVQHEAETLEIERWRGPEGATLMTANLGIAEICGGLDTLVESISHDGGQTWEQGFAGFDAVFTLDGIVHVIVDATDSQGDATALLTLDADEVATFVEHEFYGCPC